MLKEQQEADPFEKIEPVITADEVLKIQASVRAVRVEDSLRDYLLAIIGATRENPRVRIGVSPRGSNALQRAAQSYAYLDGRDYVLPDDIKRLARPVLAHRLVLDGALPGDGSFNDRDRVLTEILDRVEVPI